MSLLLLNKEETDVQLLENPLDYNSTPFVESFNCGGFALQTLDWFIPQSWIDYGYYVVDDEDMESLLEDCCNDILIDYKDFRYNDGYQLSIVSDYKLVPQNVEVIGFRFAYYPNEDYLVEEENEDDYQYQLDDFHFIWRDTKGNWWDKPGNGNVKVFFEDEIYEDWNGRYNGKIVWFAKEKVKCLCGEESQEV